MQIMKSAALCTFWIILLTVPSNGQQIGSVDLTHPPITDEFEERLKGPFLSNGCVKSGGGIVDGAVVPKKNQLHEITVEVTNVSSEEPAAGSAMQAQVQLRNSGNYAIKIPWNTDPNAIKRSQNPNRVTWEAAGFRVLLDRDDLKSLGQSLYGSEFSQGSMLTIQPAEWVMAKVKFRRELDHPYAEHVVRIGKRQLRVEWEQTSFTETLDLKKCEQWSGYFTYQNFYHRQSPPFTVTVISSHPHTR